MRTTSSSARRRSVISMLTSRMAAGLPRLSRCSTHWLDTNILPPPLFTWTSSPSQRLSRKSLAFMVSSGSGNSFHAAVPQDDALFEVSRQHVGKIEHPRLLAKNGGVALEGGLRAFPLGN